jgi:protein transport protein SEC61 subunit gamma and related proteins
MKTIAIKTKSFFHQCVRVWKILKKPSRNEFEQIAKVSAIGIGIIGLFGFLISTLMNFII